MVEILHYIDLFFDNLVEKSPFDRKKPSSFDIRVFYPSWETHPKRQTGYNLQNNTAKTPNIDNPRVFVLLHFVEHENVILELVLKKNVIENFWRHVLGSGHRELFQVGEQKTGTKVYQLELFDEGLVVRTRVPKTVFPDLQQNVFSFQVTMNNIVAIDQMQSLANLDDQMLQLIDVLANPHNELLVLNLNYFKDTLYALSLF